MLVLSSSLDREVQAHKHFTGATNIYWLNELMRYVRSEGLLNNFRLYPMVARTNYGTGVTVRGLGKLTGNQMTLVNGPTWGASGVQFVGASSQYGAIADFLGSETLTVFARISHASATPTSAEPIFTQYDTGLNQRSFALYLRGDLTNDPYNLARSSDGTSASGSFEGYVDSGGNASSSDSCLVSQWVSGGGRDFWKNKTSISLSLVAGTAQTSRFNGPNRILVGAQDSSGSATLFSNMTAHATAFLTGSVTTTQRETITDLINAL